MIRNPTSWRFLSNAYTVCGSWSWHTAHVVSKEKNLKTKHHLYWKKWIDWVFDFLAEICHLCFPRLLPKFVILVSHTRSCLQCTRTQQMKGIELSQCSIILIISAISWDLQHLFLSTYFPSKNECFIILVNIPSSRTENRAHSFQWHIYNCKLVKKKRVSSMLTQSLGNIIKMCVPSWLLLFRSPLKLDAVCLDT